MRERRLRRRPKLVSNANWQIRRKNGMSMTGQGSCGAAALVLVVSKKGSSRQYAA